MHKKRQGIALAFFIACIESYPLAVLVVDKSCPTRYYYRDMSKKKITAFIILAIALLFAAFFIGSLSASGKYNAFLQSISLKRSNNPAYPFVHPITGLSSANADTVGQFGSLESKIKAIFAANSSTVGRYSVYLKDQNTGLWLGINENDMYNPASMLKIALAIAAYKQAEEQPGFLAKSEVYTPALAAINTSLPFSLPSELKVNGSYTIQDLIDKMLIDSDNGAKDILGNTIDPDIIQDVYTNLDVEAPKDGDDYTISTKKYTAFFRSLYNATYLSQADSNALLSLLSQATFDSGLVAGVPSTVTVAHKYGEFVSDNNGTLTSMELHDCGVIYAPNDPYILCIMTEGKDEADLSSVIAAVSKVVYQEVTNNYK